MAGKKVSRSKVETDKEEKGAIGTFGPTDKAGTLAKCSFVPARLVCMGQVPPLGQNAGSQEYGDGASS